MKIKVENSVRKISFQYVPIRSRWLVSVNNSLVCSNNSRVNLPLEWNTLDDAVKEMQARGLIPNDFDIESLKSCSVVEVEG
jgi:hypothetical protein